MVSIYCSIVVSVSPLQSTDNQSPSVISRNIATVLKRVEKYTYQTPLVVDKDMLEIKYVH
jgi:hypothetical protein